MIVQEQLKWNAEMVKIFSLVFHMSEFKSDWALQNPDMLGEKNQVGFAFPVPVAVGVGMKTCELRINTKSNNAVFKLFFKVEEQVITDLIMHFGDRMIDLVFWCCFFFF